MNNFDHTVNVRLADLLLYPFEQVYKENPFDPHLTHQEIASFCGTSRESITNTPNQFEKDGLLAVKHKEITILDHRMLLKLRIIG
jgi:CRP-like cAMP-binding protein